MLLLKNEYDTDYVKSVLSTHRRIREQLTSSRITLIQELEELRAKYELIVATSSIRIDDMPFSTNDISDPTFTKVIELDSEKIQEEIDSLNYMLTSNAEIERRVKRIIYIYIKTSEIIPIHHYVTNLAWYEEPTMKQDDIARDIRRAKSVIRDILHNEAKAISIIANSNYDTCAINQMPSGELLNYIMHKDKNLYESIIKQERGGIMK